MMTLYDILVPAVVFFVIVICAIGLLVTAGPKDQE